jgi:hypothetical protein
MIANLLTRGKAKNDPNFGEFRDKVLALISGMKLMLRNFRRRQFATLGRSVEDGRFHGQVPAG